MCRVVLPVPVLPLASTRGGRRPLANGSMDGFCHIFVGPNVHRKKLEWGHDTTKEVISLSIFLV